MCMNAWAESRIGLYILLFLLFTIRMSNTYFWAYEVTKKMATSFMCVCMRMPIHMTFSSFSAESLFCSDQVNPFFVFIHLFILRKNSLSVCLPLSLPFEFEIEWNNKTSMAKNRCRIVHFLQSNSTIVVHYASNLWNLKQLPIFWSFFYNLSDLYLSQMDLHQHANGFFSVFLCCVFESRELESLDNDQWAAAAAASVVPDKYLVCEWASCKMHLNRNETNCTQN